MPKAVNPPKSIGPAGYGVPVAVILCRTCNVATTVVNTRGVLGGDRIRRQRRCPECNETLTTWESQTPTPTREEVSAALDEFHGSAVHVAELLRELKAAETADLRCEICGEPAGGGGALCPVHLAEAGIRA